MNYNFVCFVSAAGPFEISENHLGSDHTTFLDTQTRTFSMCHSCWNHHALYLACRKLGCCAMMMCCDNQRNDVFKYLAVADGWNEIRKIERHHYIFTLPKRNKLVRKFTHICAVHFSNIRPVLAKFKNEVMTYDFVCFVSAAGPCQISENSFDLIEQHLLLYQHARFRLVTVAEICMQVIWRAEN